MYSIVEDTSLGVQFLKRTADGTDEDPTKVTITHAAKVFTEYKDGGWVRTCGSREFLWQAEPPYIVPSERRNPEEFRVNDLDANEEGEGFDW